jgi:hypothetical protein
MRHETSWVQLTSPLIHSIVLPTNISKLATARHLPSFENKCYDSPPLVPGGTDRDGTTHFDARNARVGARPHPTSAQRARSRDELSIAAWSQTRDVAFLDLPGAEGTFARGFTNSTLSIK